MLATPPTVLCSLPLKLIVAESGKSCGSRFHHYLCRSPHRHGVYYDNIVQMILAEMPHRTDKIMEAANYLRNQMPAIAIHARDSSAGNGGATEPHVSHVLSSRLSSRPMGWSKGTLERFAPILANGPEVSFKQKKPSSCIPMAAVKAFSATKRKAQEARALAAQQSIFPVIQSGKRTELYKLLHGMEFNPAH
jgi:hypothetical protein